MATNSEKNLWHLDPRARIISGILLLAGLMALPWGPALWITTGFSVLLIIFTRTPILRLVGAVAAFAWMLIITIVVHGFSSPGHVLWEMPITGWMLTEEGLLKGALFSGRLIVVVMAAMAISMSVRPLEGIRAIESLARPLTRFGLPVASITLAFGLALRFVPILYDEALSLRKALQARGWSPSGGIVGRIKAWLPLFIPILASGLRRGDDLAETLVLRGFDPNRVRHGMVLLSWRFRDTVAVVASIIPIVLAFINWN